MGVHLAHLTTATIIITTMTAYRLRPSRTETLIHQAVVVIGAMQAMARTGYLTRMPPALRTSALAEAPAPTATAALTMPRPAAAALPWVPLLLGRQPRRLQRAALEASLWWGRRVANVCW